MDLFGAVKLIPSWALQSLALLGAIVIFLHLLHVLHNFYIFFVRGEKKLKKYGQWASK